jgi:hypothetical protein
MLESLVFSLIGTVVFASIAVGLIWIMAAMGGGQRLQTARPSDGEASRRSGQPASPRARR